jgi:hypothetical protein
MTSNLSNKIAKSISNLSPMERDKIIQSIQRMNGKITYSNQDFDNEQYLSQDLYKACKDDQPLMYEDTEQSIYGFAK